MSKDKVSIKCGYRKDFKTQDTQLFYEGFTADDFPQKIGDKECLHCKYEDGFTCTHNKVNGFDTLSRYHAPFKRIDRVNKYNNCKYHKKRKGWF